MSKTLLDPLEEEEGGGKKRRGDDRRRGVDGKSLWQQMEEWCRGRSAWVRLPFVGWLLLMFVAYIRAPENASSLDFVNVLIHQTGHKIWGVVSETTGQWAAGMALQFVAPLFALEFLRRRFELFGCAICWGWFGTNLLWNSAYITGAVEEKFPPGAPKSSEPLHDWNRMLTGLDGLDLENVFANGYYYLGLVAVATSLYLACQQIYYMIRLDDRRFAPERRRVDISTDV